MGYPLIVTPGCTPLDLYLLGGDRLGCSTPCFQTPFVLAWGVERGGLPAQTLGACVRRMSPTD